MTKKTEQVQKLLKKITPRHRLPDPLKEGSLLENGLLTVLVRHMPQERAEAAIGTLKNAYPDWNELRVAQTQEIAAAFLTKARRDDRNAIAGMLPAARDARDFIQEVYQKTHGLELEFLREDLAGAGKLVQQMPLLGMAGGSYLLWLAGDRQLPVHGALIRVLDRVGLIARTASMKKARDVIDPLVAPGAELAFVAAFAEVADRWCDPRKPICQECVLVEDCAFGRKAYQEWKVLQVRLEAQRVKEEARQVALEKKDQARRAREEARAAKNAEALAKKQAREQQRRASADAKAQARAAAQAVRLAAAQKRAAAEQKMRAAKGRRPAVAPAARKDAKARVRVRAKVSAKAPRARSRAPRPHRRSR